MSNLLHATARHLNGGKNATAAVILAAGSSTRMGKDQNKQFLKVNGIPVLARTLLAYQKCDLIRQIVVVARPADFEQILAIRNHYGITKLNKLVPGGASRQDSARKGVNNVDSKMRYVAVADGARCLVTPEIIRRVCLRAYEFKAASAGHQICSSVKRTSALGTVKATVDRDNLWVAQTPQIFHTSLYHAALYKATADKFEVTDDNALIEHLGYQVKMVECGRENIKITKPEDLVFAEAIVAYRESDSKKG